MGRRANQRAKEMSGFLGSLFGSSSKPAPAPKVPTANDSIKNMKSTQDLLRKKQQVLEAKIQGETENAARLAKLMKTNPRKKSEALMHLKKKKLYEQQAEQLDGQILNLEQTIFAIEKADFNKHIINAQKEATKVLQHQTQEMGDVDQVEDLLADLDEAVQDVNEMAELVSAPQDFGTNIDDDDLLAELDDLELQGNESEVDAWERQNLGPQPAQPVAQPTMPTMPQAPVHLPQVPQTQLPQEEDPFADLEASMAI